MSKTDYDSLLPQLMDFAKQAGAEAADALLHEGTSNSVSVRLGKVEDVERSEGRDLGLRVMIGKRQAMVSTTDLMMQNVMPMPMTLKAK